MKFAFLIMGEYDPEQDVAVIGDGTAQIIGVSTIEQACDVARKLYEDGILCVEVCGAFGPEGAKRIIEATQGKLAVGYIVHLPEQDALFETLFAKAQ